MVMKRHSEHTIAIMEALVAHLVAEEDRCTARGVCLPAGRAIWLVLLTALLLGIAIQVSGVLGFVGHLPNPEER